MRIFNLAIKAARGDAGTLTHKINSFLLSYRTTPNIATGCTPAELLMNRGLCTRLDCLRPDLGKKVAQPTKIHSNTQER